MDFDYQHIYSDKKAHNKDKIRQKYYELFKEILVTRK